MTSGFKRAATRLLLDKLQIEASPSTAHALSRCLRWSPHLPRNRVVVRLPLGPSAAVPENVASSEEALRQPDGNERQLEDVQWNEDETGCAFSIPLAEFCKHIIDDINLSPESFWRKTFPSRRQKVVVEYSSPNLAKPFHFGHLRSTIIGNFVANLHRALGHRVTRLNYLGDWGTQYGLLGAGLKNAELRNAFPENTVDHLLQVYVRMNALVEKDPDVYDEARKYFYLMEAGDESVLREWSKVREIGIDYLKKTYQRLGVDFDEYHAESMYRTGANNVVEMCRNLGILSEREGASVVAAENADRNPIVLSKSDGTSLYLSRDVAAAMDRKERYDFDKMYYVVENGQTDHFASLRLVLEKMGMQWHSTIEHLKFGLVFGMSTRKGSVVLLDDVIEEAQHRMLEAMKSSPNTKVHVAREGVAETLGVTAIVVNDLQKLKQRSYPFDWDAIIKMKGNPGVQLQYTHARLCSLLELYKDRVDVTAFDSSCANEMPAIYLVEFLSRYDDTLADTFQQLQPCILVRYLLKLRCLINSAFKDLKVKDQPSDVARARLCLFQAARTVLNQGMKLLGLNPLRRM